MECHLFINHIYVFHRLRFYHGHGKGKILKHHLNFKKNCRRTIHTLQFQPENYCWNLQSFVWLILVYYVSADNQLSRETEKQRNMELNLEIHLRFFINTAFYLCISPFHLIKIKSDSEHQVQIYKIKSWLPQIILCIIQTLLGFLCDIYDFLKGLPRQNMKNDPAKYFQFVLNCIDAIAKMITVKKLWLDQSDILNLVNFLFHAKNIPAGQTRLTHPLFALVVSSLYAGAGIANWLFSSRAFITDDSEKCTSWRIAGWWNAMVSTGYGTLLFIGDRKNLTAGHYENQLHTGIDVFIGVVGAVGYFNM